VRRKQYDRLSQQQLSFLLLIFNWLPPQMCVKFDHAHFRRDAAVSSICLSHWYRPRLVNITVSIFPWQNISAWHCDNRQCLSSTVEFIRDFVLHCLVIYWLDMLIVSRSSSVTCYRQMSPWGFTALAMIDSLPHMQFDWSRLVFFPLGWPHQVDQLQSMHRFAADWPPTPYVYVELCEAVSTEPCSAWLL